MPIKDYRATFGALWQGVRTRVAGWCKPTHPRFALHLFLAALGTGLLLGLAWMATHRIVLAFHAPTATDAQSSGPGAPLPRPMTGGNTALSMPGIGSSSLATIEDSASTAPTAADADPSAEINLETPDIAEDTASPPTLPADAVTPERNDDIRQRLSPADPGQSSRVGQPGEVTLSVQIDEQGNPLQISVQRSSGSPAFDNAALLQVRGRHFAPTLRDGEPVPATLSVSVSLPTESH